MFNFSQILKSGIIALVMSCFLVDSTVLCAQENSNAPVVNSESASSPVFVPDENDSNLVHVLFPSMAVNGDIPNPVDLVYDCGEIVAIQSADGTIRKELSRKMFNKPNLTPGATVIDLVQAYGPIIEQIMMTSFETTGEFDEAVSMRASTVSRGPAAQQVTPSQVGQEVLNQTVKLAKRGCRTYRVFSGVFKFVGEWFFYRIPIFAVAESYSGFQIWLLGKFTVGELLTSQQMRTVEDLASIVVINGLAVLATSKTARRKAGEIKKSLIDVTKNLLAKLRRSGDPNTPVVQVANPVQQEFVKRKRGGQCAGSVGRVS